MTLNEIKMGLGERCLFNGAEYILNAVILRKTKNNEFEYQAELKDINAKSSLIITSIFLVERR